MALPAGPKTPLFTVGAACLLGAQKQCYLPHRSHLGARNGRSSLLGAARALESAARACLGATGALESAARACLGAAGALEIPLGPASEPPKRSKIPPRPASEPPECAKIPLGPASEPPERLEMPLGPASELRLPFRPLRSMLALEKCARICVQSWRSRIALEDAAFGFCCTPLILILYTLSLCMDMHGITLVYPPAPLWGHQAVKDNLRIQLSKQCGMSCLHVLDVTGSPVVLLDCLIVLAVLQSGCLHAYS